ncbi:MAG: hypothetical protein WC823_04820 [Parcubacteria group bacterium]
MEHIKKERKEDGMIMNLFRSNEIMGTLLLVLALLLLAARNTEPGKEWLTKKFGEGWKKKALIQFLGWPMIIVVPIMYLPDQFRMDIAGVGAAFVVFLIWRALIKKDKTEESAEGSAPKEGAETVK